MCREVLRISSYLRDRYGKHTLEDEEISKELLMSSATVTLLLKSGTVRSRHVDDVSEYIIEIEKDNE